MKKLGSVEDLERLRSGILAKRDPKRPSIAVSCGTCCQEGQKIFETFQTEADKRKLTDKIDIRRTGCQGFCQVEPIVTLRPQGVFYVKVIPEDAPEILDETIIKGNIIDRLLYIDPNTGKKATYKKDVTFYQKQMRIVLGNNEMVDPANIDDYLAVGGYSALAKALFRMKPKDIVDAIKRSGLRGRGGAGFPTGIKWETCRNVPSQTRYVICNCDEGDPGAYMDRSLLEGNPNSILEGMIIGAYAVGANEGFIYVRHEYPLAVKNSTIAMIQAREYGLLGSDILGSGFDFDVRITMGGGAFVAGESTALMASIEGKPAEPRAKYIHTTETGLWSKPTVLNNVETWANVPFIVTRGPEWFSKMGTEKSKGTKIFALVGKVHNTGLVEVPMGITLREIVNDIGGGVVEGRELKAVQTGGPSGGCIPAQLMDIPVDYDRLTEAGSMMGSGGMIVMDDRTCMVDVAKFFLTFLQEESCGKCVPCREGIKRMLEVIDDISSGRGTEEHLKLLEDLADVVKDVSLCGLGQTAPNPVLSTIRYFREEYESHLRKKCPAKVCRHLIHYVVDRGKCTGCGVCKKLCPQNAITGEPKGTHSISDTSCVRCNICLENCSFSAIMVE